jgi:hypothetical protein
MPQISTDAYGFVWFNTIGGPLILSPLESLPSWQGVDDSRHDLICQEDQPWITRVPPSKTDNRFLLSLWVEPTAACWQADPVSPTKLGLLWRWVHGKKTYKLPGSELPETAKEIEKLAGVNVPGCDYLLFDAVDSGPDGLESGVKITFRRPIQSIATFEYRPDPVTLFIVHELVG